MGGDRAPGEIVAGAAEPPRPRASRSSSSARPTSQGRGDLPLIAATEVIAMDEDPASGVRRKKDSTLVRAAEAVRDGKASAMVSAGNTGATMAVGAAADGPHQGRQPPGDRHADPGARLDADRPARRRRQRRGAARVARAVRPDGLGLRPPPLRHRRAAGRPAVDRRGAGQGRLAAQGGVRAARGRARASTSSATSRAATS